MIRVFSFLLFLSVHSLQAGPIHWHAGSLVLVDERVRVGEVSVVGEFDLVLFHDGDLVTVYPAHKIRSLFYYDQQVNINRKFISVVDTGEVSVFHRLYEIVVQGEVSVWRRQKKFSSGTDDGLDYNYYVRWNDAVYPLIKFRTGIFPGLIKNSPPQLHEFIAQYTLNCNRDSDAIRIIDFYNQQTRSEAIALK